jgi:hypothetical protein
MIPQLMVQPMPEGCLFAEWETIGRRAAEAQDAHGSLWLPLCEAKGVEGAPILRANNKLIPITHEHSIRTVHRPEEAAGTFQNQQNRCRKENAEAEQFLDWNVLIRLTH